VQDVDDEGAVDAGFEQPVLRRALDCALSAEAACLSALRRSIVDIVGM
jgi:hypothetical protein